ncbi:MAG TPA: prepilin-type N-terminal cleavage/methylation domain-containing protein [bacterium]|nr:prepilin-type N-terminal cleavage/methylation domain-containing protein [bacterium]HPP87376.1 prepilin-type N-terminal cleavage/methylation domain-containing protein [bacterium]
MVWHLANIKNGFTLIELIIVIIIIGIIVSIIPVMITNYLKSQDLITSVELLENSIKFTQSTSNSQYKSKIIINKLLNEYYINTQNFSDTIQLPKNINIQSSPDSIVFNYKGVASNLEDKNIVLTNGEKNIGITIKKITGAIIKN